jgi:hypothetical protein
MEKNTGWVSSKEAVKKLKKVTQKRHMYHLKLPLSVLVLGERISSHI